MYKATLRSAWAEINLINLEHNLKSIIARVGSDKKIVAVVKADAYGHGAVKVAQTLRDHDNIRCFAVSSLEEAITLRDGGIEDEIILFCLVPDICADIIIKYDLIPVISSFEKAKAFSDEAVIRNTKIKGFLAIDTGMGRIGLLADDAESVEITKNIAALPGFEIAGLFSHFSCADWQDKEYSKQQMKSYTGFIDRLAIENMHFESCTFANSAAIIDLPEAYYDAVRPGIILYGCYPSDEVNKDRLDIAPVMAVKAKIAHLKTVPAGSSISYGKAFTTERESKIATITLGYADGLPRRYSAEGKVLINGHFAPIAGNICMDQCMIDVTDVPDVRIGDVVTVMGTDGRQSITADDIATASGVLNYEILCGFRQRLPKVYIE